MMRLDRYSRCIKKYLFVSLLYKYAEKFFIQCKSYSLTSVFRLNEKLFQHGIVINIIHKCYCSDYDTIFDSNEKFSASAYIGISNIQQIRLLLKWEIYFCLFILNVQYQVNYLLLELLTITNNPHTFQLKRIISYISQ